MPRRSATRLRFGPYQPPRYHRGDTIHCDVRGETSIVGMTAGPIPWPIGKFGRSRAIVVCGDLVRALSREAACAIIHGWGVGKTTVNKWRRALGVARLTLGAFCQLGGELGEQQVQFDAVSVAATCPVSNTGE